MIKTRSEKESSSIRLAAVSTLSILLVFAVVIGGYYVIRCYKTRGNTGPGDFLETFDYGKIDEKIVILTSGGTKYSIEDNKLFFDQGSSPQDAHMWYYSNPIDLTKPFTIRIRVKTDNYIQSAIQGCSVLMLWSCEKDFPELYHGGRLPHPNEFLQITLQGNSGGFNSGVRRTYAVVHGNPSCNWNFRTKKWEMGSSVPYEMCYPYPDATFISIELHSTPEHFFIRWREESGALLYETSPKKWKSVTRIKTGSKIYLAGGEQLTGWWSNDQWVDFIEVKYEK